MRSGHADEASDVVSMMTDAMNGWTSGSSRLVDSIQHRRWIQQHRILLIWVCSSMFADRCAPAVGRLLGHNQCFAHYVHRWFTFDDRKPVSWTFPRPYLCTSSAWAVHLTVGWLTTFFTETCAF